MYTVALLSKPLRLTTQKRHKAYIDSTSQGTPGAFVPDLQSAMELWQQGFFGKGTLSRSEPSWFGRTSRRLGLDGGELTLEEITEARRAKRRKFKKEREQQQLLELKQKQKEGVLNPADANLLDKNEKKQIEDNENNAADSDAVVTKVRKEDTDLIKDGVIEKLETLHLHPCEAVFLCVCLGVLEIDGIETIQQLLQTFFPEDSDWQKYVVYHYFRSLGWCVRDGIKFGVDWLIYKQGPPFQHAEFAVSVQPSSGRPDWWWLHANMRVVNNAKKAMTLVYVTKEERPDYTKISNVAAFRKALSQYTVKILTFSRFTPSRCRD